MLRSLFLLAVSFALASAGQSQRCDEECGDGALCYNGVYDADDCMCICRDAENDKCVVAPTPMPPGGELGRVTFEKDGKTYSKSVIEYTGTNKKVKVVAEEDEPYYELFCPTGWFKKETKNPALGKSHHWPAAKAANHPSLTCYQNCPTTYQAKGVTITPVNPQCDCEITLDYEDTACDLADSTEENLSKGCKWSGRITDTDNGWRIHFLEGEFEKLTKEPECAPGWTKYPTEQTGGHIVCAKLGTCKERMPEIPCGSQDPELQIVQKAFLKAVMEVAMPEYQKLEGGKYLDPDFTPCAQVALTSSATDGTKDAGAISPNPKPAFPQPVAAAAPAKTSSKSSGSKSGSKKKSSGKAKLLELASKASTPNKYGPLELALRCIGVGSKLAEVHINSESGMCEEDGWGANSYCADKDFECLVEFPTDEKIYSNSALNAGGTFMSADVTTAPVPPKLNRDNMVEVYGEGLNSDEPLINIKRAADAFEPGKPPMSCIHIAKQIRDHMSSVTESGDRNIRGCIEAAFKKNGIPKFPNWDTVAKDYITKMRGTSEFQSRGAKRGVMGKADCKKLDKKDARKQKKTAKKLSNKAKKRQELGEQQAEKDKICIYDEQLYIKETKKKSEKKKNTVVVTRTIETYVAKSKFRNEHTCGSGERSDTCVWDPTGYCKSKDGSQKPEAAQIKEAKAANGRK